MILEYVLEWFQMVLAPMSVLESLAMNVAYISAVQDTDRWSVVLMMQDMAQSLAALMVDKRLAIPLGMVPRAEPEPLEPESRAPELPVIAEMLLLSPFPPKSLTTSASQGYPYEKSQPVADS